MQAVADTSEVTVWEGSPLDLYLRGIEQDRADYLRGVEASYDAKLEREAARHRDEEQALRYAAEHAALEAASVAQAISEQRQALEVQAKAVAALAASVDAYNAKLARLAEAEAAEERLDAEALVARVAAVVRAALPKAKACVRREITRDKMELIAYVDEYGADDEHLRRVVVRRDERGMITATEEE